jgi:glyoxylase-like metal-dependent hydrolase (beta-lactamase superfamily II)
MRIHAFETGTVSVKQNQVRGRGPGRLRTLNVLAGREWTDQVPILAWLIEHDEGLIMVDTGETARTAEPDYFPRWHPYYSKATRFRVPLGREIGPQLRAAGFDAADVTKVVMTHMHTDHAGGLREFENAEILMSARELKGIRSPLAQVDGYLTNRLPDWLDPAAVTFDDGPFHGFAKSATLTQAGDVHVVSTPGHTPGHVSVIVDEGDKLVMLAGDTSYLESTMLDRAVDGVSPRASVARNTLVAIQQTAREHDLVYLPTHDPESEKRLTERASVPRL